MSYRRAYSDLEAMMLLISTSTSPFSTAAIFLTAGVVRRVTKEISNMKKLAIHVALMFAITASGAALFAQESAEQAPPGQSPMGLHTQPPTAEQRLQRMTQQLNLTSQQQQQVKPILDSETQQMQALRQGSSLSQQDRMTKMQDIRQSSGSQIKALLNSDQQAKFERMMSRQGHGGPHGAYGQNAPSGPPRDGSAAPPPDPQ